MSITQDELVWVLTDYGQHRLATVLTNPTDRLFLQKVKIGDAKGQYYTPKSSALGLINEVGSFFIHEKSKNEETKEVSFITNIPENSNNYEIREVGLYETLNGIDYLFAISTQQPLAKPPVDLNYLISMDLTITLRSTNLLSVYDQIELDADSDYIKEGELEQLKADILFSEGNLIKQISDNTHVLGLNRAVQLFEKIEKDTQLYSYNSVLLNFNYLTNICDIDDIYAYWVFNYTNHNKTVNITDLGLNGYNLELSENNSVVTKGIKGLAPYLGMLNLSTYSLNSSDVLFTLTNHALDCPFVLSTVLEVNKNGEDHTILAKSNHAINKHEFEFTVTKNNGLRVRLYSSSNNYIEFNTIDNVLKDGFNSIIFKYNGRVNIPSMKVLVGLESIEMNVSRVGTYSGTGIQQELDTCSYITNRTGLLEQHIDSKISNIYIIKKDISDSGLKYLALSNLALIGEDTCLVL